MNLTAWLAGAEPLTGGRSNLTYLVTDRDGQRRVLRRPPAHSPAHDVIREARILTALRSTPVPVPAVLDVCDDPPFFVMEYVEGSPLTDEGRRRSGFALIDTLLALHSLPPSVVGLGSRPGNYFERQLRRWYGQWEATRTRPLPALSAAYRFLLSAVPPQTRTGIVHGDYRLDNCLFSPSGAILAVLDWELCTVGDPLADLALLLVYWAEPGDPVTALEDPPTLAPGFPTRAELLSSYLARSSVEPAELDFAIAFSWWKLACVVEGVYGRLRSGTITAPDRDPQTFADQATRLAHQALAVTAGIRSR